MTIVISKISDLEKLEYRVYLYDGEKLVWSNEPLRRMMNSLSGKKVEFSKQVHLQERVILFKFKFGFEVRVSQIRIDIFKENVRMYSRYYNLPYSFRLNPDDILEVNWRLEIK